MQIKKKLSVTKSINKTLFAKNNYQPRSFWNSSQEYLFDTAKYCRIYNVYFHPDNFFIIRMIMLSLIAMFFLLLMNWMSF